MNIKCAGQFEIDLLAIDAITGERYHIESGVSVSGSYSKLNHKPFSTEDLKTRTKQAGQRRTLGYFTERKFGQPEVIKELKRIELWHFPAILSEISNALKQERTYFTDDTMRTLHLFNMAQRDAGAPTH